MGQTTDKKLRPQPTKMNSFMSGPSESDARPTGVQLKKATYLSTMIGLKTKHADLHNIQVITYTFVRCYDFSELKRKIIPSYKFLKFVNQVTINSGSERPSLKSVFSPILNLEINSECLR